MLWLFKALDRLRLGREVLTMSPALTGFDDNK